MPATGISIAAPPGVARVGRKRAEPDTSTYEGEISKRLGFLLRRAKMTPAEFAEALGITEAAVDHWLAGRRTPPINRWPKIAEVLGLSSPRALLP